MRAVDTNVLVRLVAPDDQRQFARAVEFVERGAWASHVVLAELSWVLGAVYGFDDAAIIAALEMLLEQEDLTVQDPDVAAAALEHYRRKPVLGFADCLILEIARKAGHLPLGTFDKALGKLDGAQRL
jgi:predicted nucleic-acid-binding protein